MNLFLDKIFWALLALACAPSLVEHIRRLWNFEQYHYLPALALALGFVLNARWNRKLDTHFGWMGWSLLVAGFLFLGGGIAIPSGWLGSLGFVFLLGAWLESHRESSGRSLLSLWPLSWLILSLPLGFDSALTNWLQRQSTRLSSFFMDLVNIPHVQFGNVIELVKGKLFVEQACSGVQSLYTLVFVAFLIVTVMRRPTLLLPLYFLAAVLWAGLMNVVRIFTIAYFTHFYGVDLAHGWQHQVLGYACLGLAILLLLSTDRLFRVFFFPVESRDSEGPESNPWVYFWNRRLGGDLVRVNERADKPILGFEPIRTVFLGLAVLLSGLACFQFTASMVRSSPELVAVKRDPFLTLPEKLNSLGVDGFVQTSFERIRGDINRPFGENADVWHGVYQDIPVTLAVNQPYPEWHDLCLCYEGNGLQLNSKETVADPDWNYVNARLLGKTGGVTLVLFSGLAANASPVEPPSEGILGSLAVRLRSGDSVVKKHLPQGDIALIQLVFESDELLLPETAAILTEAFQKFRTAIRNECQKREPKL